MLLTFMSYAAGKRLPSQIDINNKISSLADASAVYVFKKKSVAQSFRSYGIKCLKYAGRNQKLHAKYSTKLSELVKKNSKRKLISLGKTPKVLSFRILSEMFFVILLNTIVLSYSRH